MMIYTMSTSGGKEPEVTLTLSSGVVCAPCCTRRGRVIVIEISRNGGVDRKFVLALTNGGITRGNPS